eukprot:1947119-Rhodomonas_salina.1
MPSSLCREQRSCLPDWSDALGRALDSSAMRGLTVPPQSNAREAPRSQRFLQLWADSRSRSLGSSPRVRDRGEERRAKRRNGNGAEGGEKQAATLDVLGDVNG